MAEEKPPALPEEAVPSDEPISAYDLSAEPAQRTRRRPPSDAPQYADEVAPSGYGCADVITAFFLLLSVGVIALTVLLIANPYAPLNPFPPPTPLALLVLATPEPTLTPSATFTPEPPTVPPPTEPPTATPTEAPTATATETPTPTITPTPVVGGIISLAPTPTLFEIPPATQSGTRSPYPFSLKAIRYQAHDGSEGCRWQSLAGLVLNLQGQPRTREEGNLTVRITSADGNIDEFHYTGEQPKFGPSGFEAFLGTTPRVGDYTVQLLGITGVPISEKVTVQTRSGCDENVVVVEFVQNYIY
ncbi:MAG: hypothetical protein CUN49_11205 [Candidatus Thermofonsia Clade 1 bacterium]|jgi:type VI secretion system secreted protein VgrG|uniref:Uncharacterized protein n=1 Tax=Candidatus Thermofonsia Clade 1 bacterium TaxID=2364210 RepID=A0A2M8PCP9_9CHLR|nr:MAG: hypothetical protein CUN49_11205 [Candidatus Thermofonsia Clade 1 bacterium]RMF50956.1 MAG: hypothetical protein D6749_09185 [Chloroflexota bacterium]